MGSLNQDGSKISQSRESVRNVGGANILSADRVESEVIRERSPEAASDDLGTNADLTTSQYSTVSLSETQKITESVDETLISREDDREDFTPDPNHQPREWVALIGGGGAVTPDLEAVLAEGNTGSGIILNEIHFADGQAQGTLHIYGPTDDNLNVSAVGVAIEFEDGGSFGVSDQGSNNYFDITSGEGTLVTEGSTMLEIGGTLSIDGVAAIQLNTNTAAGQTVYFGGPLFSSDSYVHGLKHVEVVTIASGAAIELAAESGQVIIVKGSNVRTVNLASSPTVGLYYDIKDGDGTASSGNITVDGNGNNIDGTSSFALDVNYASYTFVYNGAEWNLI